MDLVGITADAASDVFSYNRKNYLYDREMRQEQELSVLEFRIRQADLWREDIRDLADLTIKKMDVYTTVNVLQAGFCIMLLTAGRLEPGTPGWLLMLYLLSLCGALTYLVLAVWFAMYASVAAQAASTRILTQMVRLPIPSWENIEATRTYGASFETLTSGNILRLPFLQTMVRSWVEEAGEEDGGVEVPGTQVQGQGSAAAGVDPWHLERAGKDIDELQTRPCATRPHIHLMRRATAQWQAFEGFSRVCMTVGTTQMLMAIMYYCLGYLLVEDGALWSCAMVVILLVCVAGTMLWLDLSLTQEQWFRMKVLLCLGPASGFAAGWFWTRYNRLGQDMAQFVLPLSFSSHAAFIFYVLFDTAEPIQTLNGSWIPLRWRAVVYLDVFGWLFSKHKRVRQRKSAKESGKTRRAGGYELLQPEALSRGWFRKYLGGMWFKGKEIHDSSSSEEDENDELVSVKESLVDELRQVALELDEWSDEYIRSVISDEVKARIKKCQEEFQKMELQHFHKLMKGQTIVFETRPEGSSRWFVLEEHNDFGGSASHHLFQPKTGSVKTLSEFKAEFIDQVEDPLSVPGLENRLRNLPSLISHYERLEGLMGNPKLGDPLQTGISSVAPPSEAGNDGPRPHDNRVVHRPADVGLTARQEAFPMPFGNPRAMRPEDVIAVIREPPTGTVKKAVRTDPTSHKPSHKPVHIVQGVGHPLITPSCDGHSFHAESYAPPVKRKTEGSPATSSSPSQKRKLDENLAIGSVPFNIFWWLSFVLGLTWCGAAFWSVTRVMGFPDTSALPLPDLEFSDNSSDILDPSMMESDKVDTSVVEPEEEDERRLQMLEIEPLGASWSEVPLEPKSFGCDTEGQSFVVGDAFGIFSSGSPGVMFGNFASFALTPCEELEGKVALDVGVRCSTARCSAFILHSDVATHITECSLSEGSSIRGRTWKISDDWLDDAHQERIDSIASGSCGGVVDTATDLASDLHACLVISTTMGRMGQLRRHRWRENELVPAWLVRSHVGLKRDPSVVSFQLLPSGYLLWLDTVRGSVRALNTEQGRYAGEWSLVKGVQWIGLCSAGSVLYLLGEQGAGPSLWRFSTPKALTSREPSGTDLLLHGY